MNWTDPDNGWQTSTELVEDTVAISHYGRNLVKMDAFGCTSRGQAHRAGLWLIKTELLETQTVDFSVGAEGLRHVPGDVIEVCDEDYAGISLGGRILSVDRARRILTLDREITLPSSGTTLISLVDGEGLPVSVDVTVCYRRCAGSGQPDTGRRGGIQRLGAETAVAAPASLPVCGCPGK